MSCSLTTLDLLVSAGADVNSYGAIYQAARRERIGFLVLQRLMAAGANFPEDAEQQERLINCSLDYFSDRVSGKEILTIEEIFSDGIGATLLFLLCKLPRVGTRDKGWMPILQIAACLDDAHSVEILLSRGTDVNCSGSYHGTALQAAARHGHLNMVRKLLDEGAQVNKTGGELGTALRAAIVAGHMDVFQLLVNHGADLKVDYGGSQNGENHDTLQLAVRTLSLDIVREVIDRGADPTLDVKDGTQHPLIFAVNTGLTAIVSLLLDAGAPVNVCGSRNSARDGSPIHAASLEGNMDILDLLLHFGADFELEIANLGTPLVVAASAGHIEVMEKLLSVGARVSGKNLLNGAIRAGKTEAVKLLLASGANPNDDGLSMACYLNHLDIAELLLNQTLSDDAREGLFDQAYSTKGLSGPVTRLLLEFSCPTIPQFLQACATGSGACVELLLQEDCIDVNGRAQESGNYPLQVAALHLQAEVVEILVVHGADIDCQTSSHGSPLIRSLEACAAPILRSLDGKDISLIVEQMSLPKVSGSDVWLRRASNDEKFRCRRIVESLITRRPSALRSHSLLGPPLHLACLIGDEPLVELVSKHDKQDPFAIAGHFQTALFAAIQGANPNVVQLLLKGASPKHVRNVNPEYGTALHFACALQNGMATALLLQHEADATIYDTQNRTPLTVAIQGELTAHRPPFDGYDNPLKILLD
ncbi:multiple ankyrin repeats single kh domain-containing protein [Colletotrichum plurivorum]|uniref:Multiple ankyrin repeats single kh domain-containing protein n=1 Tax=Colletotrichum plurivorum TaxID=2175906 RepID=A0A8H6JIE7_9PEZI|nr:multiple ankyrin repeats single kh domain-containing protein [Colletotrichum plurivorum]